jgi:hypothetical protein
MQSYFAILTPSHSIATDKVYNLPSTRLRDAVRAEYVNTNYSVVNPRTLDAVSLNHLYDTSSIASATAGA